MLVHALDRQVPGGRIRASPCLHQASASERPGQLGNPIGQGAARFQTPDSLPSITGGGEERPSADEGRSAGATPIPAGYESPRVASRIRR